jgi:hypothetical protein
VNIDIVHSLIKDENNLLEHLKGEKSEDILLSLSGKYPKELLIGVAEQLKSIPLLKTKHPNWHEKGVLVEKSLLEQSTPEEVAKYRSKLMAGKSLCDCTGGMGVDTIALSDSFENVTFCELDEGRATLFEYNSKLFNKEIDIEIGDSIKFLKSQKNSFSWLFLDPARRDTKGKRFIRLEECSPNIVEHFETLKNSSKNIGVKISPAYEISELFKLFTEITNIYIISWNGEVRELFVTFEGKPNKNIIAVSLDFNYHIESNTSNIETVSSLDFKYLYEPDPAIIKARLIDVLGDNFSLKRFSLQTPFLVGNNYCPNFPGRVIKVNSILKWSKKGFKEFIKKENISKSVIIRRDFPISVEEIRKRFKLKESENNFLIFSTHKLGKFVISGDRIV